MSHRMVVNSAPLLIFFAWDSPLQRFTGRFDRFEIQKLPCNRFTGRFYRFTDRFDRFTGRFDRWALMGRPIFFFFDLTLNPRKLY